MASILDIAKEANVAPSTVSLVANGHPRVAEDTRKRVQSVIKRMGWKPRSSSTRQKRHIGVVYTRTMIVSGELVDYCRKWIAGIRESFGENSADITVSVGESHIDQDLMFKRNVESGDFNGLVMMGAKKDDGYIDCVLKAGLPLVVMNQKPVDSEFSSVRADSKAGGKLAAKHLLELGHEQIAILMPKPESDRHYAIGPGRDLRAGFLEVMDAAGITPAVNVDDHAPLGEDTESMKPIARQLLDFGATACFTGDPIAKRLANALEELGVDVPGEFSVLGWDNLGFSTEDGKELTSIGYDKNVMGLLSGQMLGNLLDMNGSITNLTATVPVQLNKGQTTAPISGRTGVPPSRVCCAHQSYDTKETNKGSFTEQNEPELAGV